MSERDRGRERDRDRDRERERRRDKDDRERDRLRRDRDRTKRSRTPDRTRSRHARSRTRSPDPHRRSRSRTPDRSGRRHHHPRSPSPDPPRKRHKRGEEDGQRAAAAVSEFVDGIAREQQKHQKGLTAEGDGAEEGGGGGDGEINADEIEMMKMLGIPVGFDSTKGKHVSDADVSGVRAVTKRQPRQYMNRRGGFNRPLPAEKNR